MWKVIFLILAGLYTLNPYDLLPDFMIGWGWIDDLIIWGLVWRYLAWDPYHILEIDRSASAAEIKQAYRELALKYHPDKLEHLGDDFKALAEMRFKEIQKAYQELSGKGS